jgi:phosphoribosylamine--glycine ligase
MSSADFLGVCCMKVLVIGQGGREHALVHAFSKSPSVTSIHALPGSDGIATLATCHQISMSDFEAILALCKAENFQFVFIGPEEPLVNGLSDLLRSNKVAVVGPSKNAAQLEGSKIFAKEFMKEAGISTAKYIVVDSVEATLKSAIQFQPPYVLKADGLAAGKGVYICKTLRELEVAAEQFFEQKIFGEAGTRAILEQFTKGSELSFLVLTNGSEFQALPIAKDHKKLLDKDEGPNTGGMGTIAPFAITQKLRLQIEQNIVQPTLMLLKKRGYQYRGIVFFGLMLTEKGPSLLEYNCRFGDPETQVILPLIENDIGKLFLDLAHGKLQSVQTKKQAATCVVLAAPGYPMNPEKGLPIEGSFDQNKNAYFLHAGTKNNNGQWVTNGGRVLCAVGVGTTLIESKQNAYQLARQIKWSGMQMRNDIGDIETATKSNVN